MPDLRGSLSRLCFAFAAIAPSVSIQYSYGAIASCADFECNTGIANCTVQGHDYAVAGSVSFSQPFSAAKLTWRTGVVTTYPNGTQAPTLYSTIVKEYYLGVPPDLNLRQDTVAGHFGRAAFFIDSNTTFPLEQEPGTCRDVLGNDCVRFLQGVASTGIESSEMRINSSEVLCSMLRDELNAEDVLPQCSSTLLGASFGRVEF